MPDNLELFPNDALTPGGGVLSIGEFTRRLKGIVEGIFSAVSVRGEISNLRRQTSGHVYFTLKDADSQLAAVLFRGDALRTRCPLRDGLQVVATGSVSVYEPRGSYQLVVRSIEEDGVGRLQQAFEHLKQKLAAEGLFDSAAKRPLPVLPRTLGIITSPTGAALQDFLRILRRRNWRGRVVVLPVRVQGAEAAPEIAAMLASANRMALFDLLVLARGGGSLEDLWPFNEEIVVRAVRASAVPIISAVGHEIDFTLSDFAADVRAETPSAAAELITSGFLSFAERVDRAGAALQSILQHRHEILFRRLALLRAELEQHSPARRVESIWLRLDDLRNRLQAAPQLRLGVVRHHLLALKSRLRTCAPGERARMARYQLSSLAERLDKAILQRSERAAERLAALEHRLKSVGVEATLRRGFTLVRDDAGKLVRSAGGVASGKSLHIRFVDGSAEVVVK
ncbi:MAG: exodeoxyribonuclease VII large subunit [Puniceicoccales bacterium]|jgi:exodeoxyribonuclease VII large subunit|nr:exodeoxyribonuclease VII large subunit [Puniceicoccales bacterium]